MCKQKTAYARRISDWSSDVCSSDLACGVIFCDDNLSTRARKRDQQGLVEFPTVAELLALAVAAGESPVAALDRVVRRSRGALSEDLSRVLAAIRTGQPVSAAFDDLASRSGLPVVSRFASGVAVAIDRGTPPADESGRAWCKGRGGH